MNYKFSGHETFPCRYAWLPKAYRLLRESKDAFANEERAMVSLGVGKNMVRAIRFWAQATGVAESVKSGGYEVTEFGTILLDGDSGLIHFLRIGEPFGSCIGSSQLMWMSHCSLGITS